MKYILIIILVCLVLIILKRIVEQKLVKLCNALWRADQWYPEDKRSKQ